MNNLASRLPSLTTVLWILASLVAFGAFLFIAPNLLNPPVPPTPTGVVLAVATPPPTATIPPTATPIPIAPPARTRSVEPSPPIPPDAVLYSFVADPTRSGYVKAGEDKGHWGDRNLHAGFFGGDSYDSILFFDVSELPPNSDIVSADLQLTGLSRDNLGANGTWTASLIRVKPFEDWADVTTSDVLTATSTTTIGNTLSPTDLDLGQVNDFQFTADQMPLLSNETQDHTYVVVRLEGPNGPGNSLFTWDGGGLDLETGAHPILQIVAHPGKFVIVTNTPTAENVITAAALAVTATDFATRVGTATPFPRAYATATPIIQVTKVPTPENVQTRVAIAQLATAVAITTGTYTPTPVNWIEVTATFTPHPTATPPAIPIGTAMAQLTLTPGATPTYTIYELVQTPVPTFLHGNIIFLSDRFGGTTPLVMKPDGTLLQALTGSTNYDLAASRTAFSPDHQRQAIVTADSRGVLQIWILDLQTQVKVPITSFAKGVSYDPAWSPADNAIAFVSTETGGDEIYVYDLGTQKMTKVTDSTGLGQPWNKHPSWSPDGGQLVFWSSRSGFEQVWKMNADGSNLQNISQNFWNDYDPVWVK